MRILIANDQHWPMRSGCAQASRTQALGLAKRGHEVLVVAPSLTSRNADDADENYKIKRVRSFKFRNNLRISVFLDREIRAILGEFQPDVVHVHTQLPMGLAVLRAAVKLGVPVVATNHVLPDNLIDNIKGASSLSRPISYIWTEYGNLLYRGARRIIMPTPSALTLFNLDRIEAPTLAISNGINLEKFKPTKASAALYEKFSIPKDKRVIGYLGRLDKEKHLDVVVKAFAGLIEDGYDDIHLLLVGGGNDAADLTALVERLGIAKFTTFTGIASEEDWPNLHKVSSIYCMPSPNELQSIGTLEAMATGKPVVAVDAGPLHELCQNDRNGYLVFVDDVRGFGRALKMLLDNKERYAQFAKESRAIAETHDENIVMPQFEQLYKEVIEENRLQPTKSHWVSRSAPSDRHSK